MTTNKSKFETIDFVINGLEINRYKENSKIVLYSDVEKVFIKKHKLTKPLGVFMLTILFFTAALVTHLVSNEIGLFVLFTFIPLMVKAYSFKWYSLNLQTTEGHLNRKVFFPKAKNKQLAIVDAIRKNKHSFYHHSLNTYKTNPINSTYHNWVAEDQCCAAL